MFATKQGSKLGGAAKKEFKGLQRAEFSNKRRANHVAEPAGQSRGNWVVKSTKNEFLLKGRLHQTNPQSCMQCEQKCKWHSPQCAAESVRPQPHLLQMWKSAIARCSRWPCNGWNKMIKNNRKNYYKWFILKNTLCSFSPLGACGHTAASNIVKGHHTEESPKLTRQQSFWRVSTWNQVLRRLKPGMYSGPCITIYTPPLPSFGMYLGRYI